MIKARVNHQIRANELRVLTVDGENLGVLTLTKALEEAKNRGLDLIEISPNANPPVARIMDHGKYLYETKKKEKSARANTVITEMKNVQVKIGTGEHDLNLKAKRVSEWLSENNKVKIDLYLSGRSKYMELPFLKERLARILKLITVEHRVIGEPIQGPKGLSIIVERSK